MIGVRQANSVYITSCQRRVENVTAECSIMFTDHNKMKNIPKYMICDNIYPTFQHLSFIQPSETYDVHRIESQWQQNENVKLSNSIRCCFRYALCAVSYILVWFHIYIHLWHTQGMWILICSLYGFLFTVDFLFTVCNTWLIFFISSSLTSTEQKIKPLKHTKSNHTAIKTVCIDIEYRNKTGWKIQ